MKAVHPVSHGIEFDLDLNGFQPEYNSLEQKVRINVPTINVPMFNMDWIEAVRKQIGDRQSDVLIDDLSMQAQTHLVARLLAERLR